MAYSIENPPTLIAQRVGDDVGGTLWVYADGDPLETVIGADYISDGDDLGMEVGDIVHAIDNADLTLNTLIVKSVTSGGAATLGGAVSQELVLTGTVTPGVTSVELNHATVIVAATLADTTSHPGLFVVKDTSASGTAAHTLTLTSGTFNGTNNVATLNAPNEALAVWFDSAGNGTIVVNVGAVVLS